MDSGTYTLLMAIWPIVHIESFMAVTGYKHDVWLVKPVGALLIPVGCGLVSYIFIRTDRRPALILGSFSCVAFICIDFYYAIADVISDVYMIDGFVQLALFCCWIYGALKHGDHLNLQTTA